MKDGFLKLAAACPDIKVGDIEYNLASCIDEAKRYSALGAKVVVFPELSLTSASCGDMFYNTGLLSLAEKALACFAERTAELDAIFFIGLPALIDGNIYNCAAAVCGGNILGLVPAQRAERQFSVAPDIYQPRRFAGVMTMFGKEQLFEEEGTGIRIAVCIGDAGHACRMGASIIAELAAEPIGIGTYDRRINRTLCDAQKHSAVIIYSNAGLGESGAECVYSGHSVIADALGNVSTREPFSDTELTMTADIGASNSLRQKSGSGELKFAPYVQGFALNMTETELPKLSRTPFVPEGEDERKAACRLAFEIQSRGLAGRFERSHSKTMVLGISGGLDSTLALLVMAKAADILAEKGVGRDAISAVTMPCFGTTERTKSNAERLAECLGARLRCIDIKAAVKRHFEDIGHDAENYDVVYENAQARERTQVLMDIANAEGGLVVGTGDLSEAALGWATYNGDHMSMYGVNASIPKTLVRAMVSNYADECDDEEIAAILRDILATPVSPELLPPKDGEIAQCTEGIVGPYELHDFFIYHFVKEGTSPEKLLRMATHAFSGVYDKETLEGWCKVFLRRFVTQQFKRSCTPDSPSIGIVSLSPRGAWQMPSDFSPSIMTIPLKK